MATAKSTTELTLARLVRETARLSADELDRLVCRLLALRAAKGKGTLPERESELLAIINRALPGDVRARYRELSAKRREETLTPAEQRELIRLSDDLEQLNAERMKSLVALAGLRQTTVAALMERLGLESMANV
jgi:hypothetical protein